MPVPQSAAFADLTTLAQGLERGDYTSVELTGFFCDRCQAHGPALNAVVAMLRDPALRQAEQLDGERKEGRLRGPLHGIPFGAKDLLSWPGAPTTWGAAPYRDRVIDSESVVLAMLRDFGAVLIAKLAMVEIAGGLGYRQANASFTGPGRNPWKTDCWSGGSSSGSGSAVAAGLVPFAIGSETWGSITTPAGYCGLTGLRPTYGLVSRHGAMTLSWSMDKIGPLTRTAADARLVFASISQPGEDRPGSGEHCGHNAAQAAPPFRLGLLKGACDSVQPVVAENFNAALDVLRTFATLVDIELPDLPYHEAADLIIACEAAAAHESLAASGAISEMTAPEDRWRIYPDLLIPAVDYLRALRWRTVIQQDIDALLAHCDAVVSPTLATVAGPLDRPFHEWSLGFESTEISAASNLAGIPAVTVPNGFGGEGLPTGLQLVGRAFGEAPILAIAEEFQRRTDWHRRTPPEFTPQSG